MKREDYIKYAIKFLKELNNENLILTYKVIYHMWIKQK